MTNYRQNQKQHYISLRGDTVGIISSIYNSGYNIKRLFLGEQELKLAYLGEQIVFNEVIDDLNYVLYEFYKGKTISNTIEAPVKRAILKGQTLVNFAQNEQGGSGVSDIKLTEGRLTWTAQWEWEKLYFVVNGKPNTKYIIKYQSINENIGIFHRPETTDPHSGWVETISASNQTITTYNEGTFVVSLENASVSSDLWIQDFMIIEYQEGMENWDIPYFEDMQSVKMPVLTTSNEDGTKTNILTVNEEVELRGIGNVKDELNLLTGELTQRIGEIIFDGSEDWRVYNNTTTNTISFRYTIPDGMTYTDNPKYMCDNFRVLRQTEALNTKESEWTFYNMAGSAMIFFNVLRSKLLSEDLNGWKLYLQANPITIQYELVTESVKTVALSHVIKPYEGTNTYHSSSETFSPTVELSVPVVSTGAQTLNEILTAE